MGTHSKFQLTINLTSSTCVSYVCYVPYLSLSLSLLIFVCMHLEAPIAKKRSWKPILQVIASIYHFNIIQINSRMH